MKSILCFGEALIDFLQVDTVLEGGLTLPQFRQFPGGAPANVAVAIAKLGGKSRFAGQVGQDPFGLFLKHALESYGVDTSSLLRHPTAPTALAFVSLDRHGDRSFSFYRSDTADMVLTPEQILPSWFSDTNCFHFCSNTLTDLSITRTTEQALLAARQQGCLISFDVNLRPGLWTDALVDRQRVQQFISLSDLIKFSRDELEFLAGDNGMALCQQLLEGGASLLLITDGANAIQVMGRGFTFDLPVPNVAVCDTTAAGDAFMGGLLYGLASTKDLWSCLRDKITLLPLVAFASNCGALAVTRPGAYTALPTLSEVTSFQKSL